MREVGGCKSDLIIGGCRLIDLERFFPYGDRADDFNVSEFVCPLCQRLVDIDHTAAAESEVDSVSRFDHSGSIVCGN